MNIFSRLLMKELVQDKRLGQPATNIESRLAMFAAMTGGRGFRMPPTEPKIDANGTTRAARKAKLRELTRPKYDLPQPEIYKHSAARRRQG